VKKHFVGFSFLGLLLATLTSVAEITQAVTTVNPVLVDQSATRSLGNSLEEFDGVAAMINEVEDRRRRVVYTAYPSSPTHGAQHGFVHVTNGSAAFSKTDVIINSAIPIVIRRAYSSLRHEDPEFGKSGWKLTISERIVPRDDGARLEYIYGNTTGVTLTNRGRIESALIAATSDIVKIDFEIGQSAEVVLRTGITKVFEISDLEYRLRSVSDRNGNSLEFKYSDGRLISIDSSDGASVDFSRDSHGRLMAIEDADGRSIEYSYDDIGLLRYVVDLRSEIWSYNYDQNELLSAAVTPLGTTDLEFSYDAERRVRSAVVNGYSNTYSYSAQITRAVDESGRATVFESNADGATKKVTNHLGTITEIETDDIGRPSTLLRNDKVVSEINYRSKGKSQHASRQSIIGPEASSRAYVVEYDRAGRVESLRSDRGDNIYTVKQYDRGLVPKHVVYSDGTSSAAKLDGAGNLDNYKSADGLSFRINWSGSDATVRLGKETAELNFDPQGKLVGLRMPDGMEAAFEYDPGGLRTKTRAANGVVIDYFYDSSGSLFYTEAGLTDETRESFSYEIDKNQRLRSVVGSGIRGHLDLDYNLDGRLLRVDSSVMNDMSFLYDDMGRLEAVLANGYPPLEYKYDVGEPDIVVQLDNRTSTVFNQQFEIDDFASRFAVYYTRVTPASHGVITYDDGLAELMPSIDPDRWTPHQYIDVAVANTKIASLFGDLETGLQSFSMPSSRFFIPPEYWSVNCCICICDRCEIP